MMRTSLTGLFASAATCIQGHRARYYRGALDELSDHLRQLRDRTEVGDLSALDEFFDIYTFDGAGAYDRKEAA